MKRVILFLILIIVIVITVVLIQISDNNHKNQEIRTFNAQFENYRNQEIYGTDVMTIINKAIDNNNTNEVKLDDTGKYIDDDNTCIKVNIILITQEEDGSIKETEYPMETLQKAGLDKFISSFSLTTFKCDLIEYNSRGRVSKIILKQLEV